MSERILAIHECVVINKIFIARIIRRIDVDYINLILIRRLQMTQHFQIIPSKEQVLTYIRGQKEKEAVK